MTDDVMPDNTTPDAGNTPESESNGNSIVSPPPTVRDTDTSDVPPPVSTSGKGPMDQSVPDVATGSTPATRHDD